MNLLTEFHSIGFSIYIYISVTLKCRDSDVILPCQFGVFTFTVEETGMNAPREIKSS